MPRKIYLFFGLFLLAVTLYHLASWPIAATDTDLWFHLNGGRYFHDMGSVARTSFFSFIEPERVWVNYYWLFQVVVYQIFSWSGYMGLIFFRTLLFCATLLMLFVYLYKDQKERDAVLYFTLLFVFYLLLLLPRSLPVRPHLFSYLLIIIFLYLLEFKSPRACWLLPPLAALWSNLHGVEYPVLLLILGGYLAEFAYERIRDGKAPNDGKHGYTKLHSCGDRGGSEEPTQAYPGVRRGERRSDNEGIHMNATWYYPGLIVFSAVAVLCTPHGIKLLAVPFKSIAYVSQFVYELRPLSFYDFLSFFGVLFCLAGFVAVTALRKGGMRISHLLLLLGGLLLLLKGKRFINEYALLALPLLRGHIPVIPAAPRAKALNLLAAALTVAFMTMPLFFMHYFFLHPPRYPVSGRELPEGVTLFLKRVGGTGPILNHPNAGGYLEWELYPGCKIFMDMQVPFLFTEGDFRTIRAAYADRNALREVISRYRPVFITAPIEMEGFKRLMADHPRYRPIFFDDAEVLYADGLLRPALVSQYEIRTVDPFSLYSAPVRSSPHDPRVLSELLRLSEIYPDGGIVNAAIATIYQSAGRYREAMPYAELIISSYPESHLGYTLKADLLSQLGECAEAVVLYGKAVHRSDGAMKNLIEMKASSCEGRPQGVK